MKYISSILGLAVVGLCLPAMATAQERGRTFDERGRQADRRTRQDDRGFDRDWGRDGSPDRGRDRDRDWDRDWDRDRDRDRRHRDRDDDTWFDPGWWHEWPPRQDRDRWDDGRRRPPRYGVPGSRHPGRDRWQQPGYRPRAALGVFFRDTYDGVRIASVVPRSPAQRAGLQRGDILLAMDGRQIDSAEEARRLIRRQQPGERVRLLYERRGRVRQTVAVLQTRRAVY